MVVNEQDLFSSHPLTTSTQKTGSLFRWLKHGFYMPWRTRYYFNAAARDKIQQAVTAAEQGHRGEIQVIIEGHLPLNMAWAGSTHTRAQQLFASYGVWDTAYNSGVLLYINLCERRVEIVADRGINQYVDATHWQQLCDRIRDKLAAGVYAAAVVDGIEALGKTLTEFYAVVEMVHAGNELPDGAIFL